ncbi:hypothetical protein Riv7116_5039 [Rivularia sp. PCC 7116]|uniref:hypothetical protein n=1 Tax=Rivularia sp. PCC 7116 TaxID=373994 RepID=UPI00029F4A37|nr:hypothetical protein [Rivularia sp. PCC 7116]AFY57441.1 hypothetical protein Riv7116_5039 [Rivularia sp. PCC 7116]
MPKSLIYRASFFSEALRQGEILTGVRQFKPVPNESLPQIEKIQFKPIIHPYAIIVSQDCDLDWDYAARQNDNKPFKLLNSIIFCEVYTAQDIRSNKENKINSSEWNLVKSNRHMQYHFLEKVPSNCELSQEGLPELTADFKKAFAIDAGFIYHQINHNIAKRRTILECPYLQDFSQRYHAYQGRVALPAQHESEKGG